MSLSVIDKYVEKKKKDLLEYSKILESLITLEENKMWNNKSEFSVYSKEIISLYADKYYFDNNIHRDNPIEYSNDNINYVLQSIIEYCKNNNKEGMLRELKNETFLLSVIICTSCYLDIATNVVDGNFKDTKTKFRYLLSYFKKTKILKVFANDKIRINGLFDAIKKNTKEDSRFFEYFKSDNCFNEYISYTKDSNYYLVDFKYSIPALDDFDDALVKKVKKSYQTKILETSLDLLSIYILEELISNRVMSIYLVNIDEVLDKKLSLLKMFDNKYYKEYIKFLVSLDKEVEFNDAINTINNMGFKVVYEFDNEENVNENKFTYDMEVIVPKEFLNNNAENKYTWDKFGVKFVIKNKED